MTLKVFYSLCVIKLIFLKRCLFGNNIYILKNFFLFITYHFFSKDFRWPDSVLTVLKIVMLNLAFKKIYTVFSVTYVHEILLSFYWALARGQGYNLGDFHGELYFFIYFTSMLCLHSVAETGLCSWNDVDRAFTVCPWQANVLVKEAYKN